MAKKKAAQNPPPTTEEMPADLKALVELGKKRGYLTHDEILEHFPEAEQNIELIDRVYSALLEQGIVSDYQEAFDRFIANGKPCHVPYEKLPTADTIAEVHSYGGITSVAHPGISAGTAALPLRSSPR